jgi:hypothetical protein
MSHIIFRKSENTNSFGLRGFWVYSPLTGDVYSAATSRALTVGQVIKDLHTGHYELVKHEFTIEPAKRAEFELLINENIRKQRVSEQKASLL